jgi:hypothetical protein
MLEVDNINSLGQHPLIELQAWRLGQEIFHDAIALVRSDREDQA